MGWLQARVMKIRLKEYEIELNNIKKRAASNNEQAAPNSAPSSAIQEELSEQTYLLDSTQGFTEKEIQVFIHYLNYHKKYDQWIDLSSDRIAEISRYSQAFGGWNNRQRKNIIPTS